MQPLARIVRILLLACALWFHSRDGTSKRAPHAIKLRPHHVKTLKRRKLALRVATLRQCRTCQAQDECGANCYVSRQARMHTKTSKNFLDNTDFLISVVLMMPLNSGGEISI